MTTTPLPERLTLGAISRALNLPMHRLKYAIESYRIEPVERAGIIRLYHRDQIPQIVGAIRRCSERAGGAR